MGTEASIKVDQMSRDIGQIKGEMKQLNDNLIVMLYVVTSRKDQHQDKRSVKQDMKNMLRTLVLRSKYMSDEIAALKNLLAEHQTHNEQVIKMLTKQEFERFSCKLDQRIENAKAGRMKSCKQEEITLPVRLHGESNELKGFAEMENTQLVPETGFNVSYVTTLSKNLRVDDAVAVDGNRLHETSVLKVIDEQSLQTGVTPSDLTEETDITPSTGSQESPDVKIAGEISTMTSLSPVADQEGSVLNEAVHDENQEKPVILTEFQASDLNDTQFSSQSAVEILQSLEQITASSIEVLTSSKPPPDSVSPVIDKQAVLSLASQQNSESTHSANVSALPVISEGLAYIDDAQTGCSSTDVFLHNLETQRVGIKLEPLGSSNASEVTFCAEGGTQSTKQENKKKRKRRYQSQSFCFPIDYKVEKPHSYKEHPYCYLSPRKAVEYNAEQIFIIDCVQSFAEKHYDVFTDPYYTQPVVCKVRLNLKFNEKNQLEVHLLVSPSTRCMRWPVYFKGEGEIYYTECKRYCHLWSFDFKKCQELDEEREAVLMADVCLLTSHGSYPRVTFARMSERQLVVDDCMKIKWRLSAYNDN